ncbi:MAG: arginase family protein, partial [Pseudomonadota bacterium]
KERSMTDSLGSGSTPTLFHCPREDLGEQDTVLVGVPHASGDGANERDQRLGPEAVRQVSAVQRRAHSYLGIDPWSVSNIADIGDVSFPSVDDNEDCVTRITEFFEKIDAAGSRPVSIGGDHSITVGIAKALGGGSLTDGKPVCLLHLDAHTNVHSKAGDATGVEDFTTSWGAYLADQGKIDPHRSMKIGLRGHPPTLDWLQPPSERGFNLVTMAEYRKHGAEKVIARARDLFEDRPVYITFDLDCLDPSVAPGVAKVEAGEKGFETHEALRLLHSVRGLNIIGGDVVGLTPTRDNPNRITALVAGVVMFEMISLIAENIAGK